MMRHKHKHTRGFGLIEAMMATAFTGIALAGAFSLSGASRATSLQSSLRMDLSMLAADMVEHIRSDRRNTDDYAMSLALTESACTALNSDIGTTPKERRHHWCSRLNALSPHDGAFSRSISVIAPDASTRMITIVLQGGAGQSALPAEIVVKRYVDIPGV